MKEKSQKSKTMQKLNQFTAQILMLLIVFGTLLYSTTGLSQIYFFNPSTSGDPKVPKDCSDKPKNDYAEANSPSNVKKYLSHTYLEIEGDILKYKESLCRIKKDTCSDCREPACGKDCGPQSASGMPCPEKCPLERTFSCVECQTPPIGPPATCEAPVSQCTVDDINSRAPAAGDPNGLVLQEGQEVVFWVQAEENPVVKKADKLMRMLEGNLVANEYFTDKELLEAPEAMITVFGMKEVKLSATVVDYTRPFLFNSGKMRVINRSEIPQTLDAINGNEDGDYYTILVFKPARDPAQDPSPPEEMYEFTLKYVYSCVKYIGWASPHGGGSTCTEWKGGWVPWKMMKGTKTDVESTLAARLERLAERETFEFNDNMLGWTEFGMRLWPGASGVEQLFYGNDFKAKAFGAVYFAGDVLSFGTGAKVKSVRIACQVVAASATALATGEMATQIYNDKSQRGFIPVAATVLLTVSAGSDGIKLLKGIRMKATRGADGALRLVPQGTPQEKELGAKLIAAAADLPDSTAARTIRNISLNGVNDAVAKRSWYVRVMKNICAALKPEPNTTVLWTGILDMPEEERIQLMYLAAEYALGTNSNSLEMMLKKAGIFDPDDIKRLAGNPSAVDWKSLVAALDDAMLGNGRIPKAQAGEFWEFVSRTIVRNSRGKVKMVMGNAVKSTAISWAEIYEALKNKNITEFVIVMPKTIGDKVVDMVEVTIWKRCDKTGELMFIDPKNNPLLQVAISVQDGWNWKEGVFKPTFTNVSNMQLVPELDWLVKKMFSENCPRLP